MTTSEKLDELQKQFDVLAVATASAIIDNERLRVWCEALTARFGLPPPPPSTLVELFTREQMIEGGSVRKAFDSTGFLCALSTPGHRLVEKKPPPT